MLLLPQKSEGCPSSAELQQLLRATWKKGIQLQSLIFLCFENRNSQEVRQVPGIMDIIQTVPRVIVYGHGKSK